MSRFIAGLPQIIARSVFQVEWRQSQIGRVGRFDQVGDAPLVAELFRVTVG